MQPKFLYFKKQKTFSASRFHKWSCLLVVTIKHEQLPPIISKSNISQKSNRFVFFTFIYSLANEAQITFQNLFVIKPNRCTNFTKFILSWNSTCFGQFVCPSSGVYSLYTQQWYMSYRCVDSFRAGAYAPARKLSANLYDIYHCWVYSE